MLSRHFKQHIEAAVQAMLSESVTDANFVAPKPAIEQPTQLEHGDYCTNIAMQLAKKLRRNPLQIAADIRTLLEQDASFMELVERMDVAPPGYVNFFVRWHHWAAGHSVHSRKSTSAMDKPKDKVLIEHTSINPNKSAHIGHLRNSCIGDTLARLMRRVGHRVEVHNYIDDLGNQLADTVVGLMHMPFDGAYGRFGDYCWDLYAKLNRRFKSEPGLALEQKRAEVLHQLEAGNNHTAWIGMLAAERIVREHLEDMGRFGISYDVLIWESSIVREGFWSDAFAKLKRCPAFQLEKTGKLAGCWVLKEPERDSADAEADYHQDKVLVRSNGILTYTAKDIAYHLWKFGLLDKDFTYRSAGEKLWSTTTGGVTKKLGRADRVINVIDKRQEYPQAMVKLALQQLGYEEEAARLHHVGYGVVSLSPATAKRLGVDTSDEKKAYPMSGRQGVGIRINELLDQMENVIERKRSRKSGLTSETVAAAAVRYYLLRFSLQTEIVFDAEQASEVSGNTGVYLLYAHARACSILRKAGLTRRNKPAVPEAAYPLGSTERSLLQLLASWPDTLNKAAAELSPAILCSYAHELASAFSHFYADCPILKAKEPQRAFRLWLTGEFQETLADVLDILGLPRPLRM